MDTQGPSNFFSRKFKAVCVENAVEYYGWVTFTAFAGTCVQEAPFLAVAGSIEVSNIMCLASLTPCYF